MIKAVIFDFFGVICSDEYWDEIKEVKDGGGDFDKLSTKLNLGKTSWQNFVSEVAADKELTTEAVEEMFREQSINPKIVAFIKKLHSRYQTALLTNANASRIKPMLARSGLDKIFDELIISSDYGVIKPDAQIFKLALAKLKVEPSQAVFIDDMPRYVAAAKSLGFKGIIYRNFDQMTEELEPILTAGPDN